MIPKSIKDRLEKQARDEFNIPVNRVKFFNLKITEEEYVTKSVNQTDDNFRKLVNTVIPGKYPDKTVVEKVKEKLRKN